MSDEVSELRIENIALKEINKKLEGKISELEEKNHKMEEEIKALKAEKLQQNSAESAIAIPTLQSNEGEGSSNSALQEKPTKQYFFPNWFFDSSPWIDRKGMANSSLSTAGEAFKQFFWPKLHGNVKPHTVKSLVYSGDELRFEDSGQIIPIASIPPLDYILGFENISIFGQVDDKIANFIKSIAHHLKNHKININVDRIKNVNKERVTSMHALLECLNYKIDEFTFKGDTCREEVEWEDNWNGFNQLCPGILNDHVHFLQFCGIVFHNYDSIDIILNWLTKQSNNGKQILFDFVESMFTINQICIPIQEEFENSNSPCNFVICFTVQVFQEDDVVEFIQENNANEILEFYCKERRNRPYGGFHHHDYYLARYPKGEEHWKEYGENKI